MHAADQIINAVLTQLAQVASTGGRAYVQPTSMINESNLPCVTIDRIQDEVAEANPGAPRTEKHKLSFEVFCVAMASTSSLRAITGTVRKEVELALLSTASAVTLGGLVRRGLERTNAVLDFDTESLQKPVGGWRLNFECTYHMRTDAPGNIS